MARGRIVETFFVWKLIIALSFAQEEVIETLGPLGVDPLPLTVSGFSSGGNMAQHLQVAFSSCFHGSAAFASVPYHCGHSNYYNYRVACNFGFRHVHSMVAEAEQFAERGEIDSLSNLKNQRHYHYVPDHDTLVFYYTQVRKNTQKFFEKVGMNPENIQLVIGKNADHWMPTTNKSFPSCTTFIGNSLAYGQNITGASFCNYDGAFEAMRFLFQDYVELSSPTADRTLEPLVAFDQSVFLSAEDANILDPVGYLYIPKDCKAEGSKCKFHVALHGCRGSRSAVGTGFITQSGYLDVAEKNNIVMMFPQSITFNGNPDGCWDVFDATGPAAATKNGKQIRALMGMIRTVTEIEGCQ